MARRRLPVVLLVAVCGLAAGCSRGIDTAYGQRKGVGASNSVNGTAVLGTMFEQAGHTVYSWQFLSPKLRQRADCIVWFPDDFQPPDAERCAWLEEWLWEQPGRTLIYVGRDFDAATWYWEKVEADAPADQLPLLRGKKANAKKEFLTARPAMPTPAESDWLTVDGKYRPRKVRTLQGPWAEGIDASKVDIELSGRLIPDGDDDVLLESDGDALVIQGQLMDGQLIMVANGSFLLNLPLVNHEHRKLAGKLISVLDNRQVGPPSQRVVFLESTAGGPPIAEDPMANLPSGWEIFLILPIAFSHLALVGILFCLSRWPIFGVPRELEPAATSDFGKHVESLAILLQRSHDRAFAMTRLLHYQQIDKSNE